jgi:uncharacterized protein YjbI with pentapeptide repeats
MANAIHLEILRQDVNAWNQLREEEPDLVPDLSGADLSHASLTVANLSRCDLSGSNLTLADLEAADLSGANLQRANLIGARLIGADLWQADIRGANLSTAEDLTEEQLEETFGDGSTKLPDGMKAPGAWERPQV